MVNEAFAEEKPHLKVLPLAPFRSVLKLEQRVSHEGMVSVGGNFYSVPDATTLANEVQIFEGSAGSHRAIGRWRPHTRQRV